MNGEPRAAVTPQDQNQGATADRPDRCTGTVVLVGAGPGDPGLMTVAGRAAVESADVILTDRLVSPEVVAWARPDALVVGVGKEPHGPATSQAEINRLLVEHATLGRTVVRLKGGDPYVFGRGGEEVQACAAAGVPVRVVPGISSAVAVPALAGIPVTHRGVSQGFTVISGHVPPGHPESTIDYGALARSGTTLVVLMGVRTLSDITTALIDGGLDPACPAVVVADGTTPEQQVLAATVETVAAAATDARIRPPAIAVIGPVAGLALDG